MKKKTKISNLSNFTAKNGTQYGIQFIGNSLPIGSRRNITTIPLRYHKS